MKRFVALLLCAFSFLAAPLRADVELSFDFYHEQLSPLGEWAEVDGYGYVWHPTGVAEDWAPYTDGYWSYTDAGWTWVSYEDWGSICYHYGRWTLLDDYGWCWVPGYEWGPAWVSWRNSDDYIGWAPLPPEVEWVEDRGISVWVDAHYEIGPRYFNFCRIRDFGAPVLRHVLLPRIRNVEICFSTVNITNISYNRDYGCVYNGGFDYDFIIARVDRPVPAFKLVQNTTVNVTNNIFVNSPRGNALVVNTPRRAANYHTPTRRPEVRRAFKRDAVKRGWSGLENADTRDRLLGKMREEAKGLSPTNAPARPVRREALAAVPEKADFTARPQGMRRLPADRNARANGAEGNRAGRGREESAAETAGSEPARSGAPGRAASSRERATAETPAATGSRGGLRKRPDNEQAGADETPGTPRVGERNPVAEKPGNGRPGMGAGRARTAESAEENAGARAKAAGEDAERSARQRQTTEKAERAGEMKRQAEQQENVARENLQRARAAEAAASRRNQVQDAANAQRANAEKLQRAKEQQAEASQRSAAQRQAESQREMQSRRQAETQRAAAAQEQREQQARAQAAAAARERAVQAQRQNAPDRDRGQAAAAAQARAQAQAQQQARAQAQAQQQQRAAQAQQQQRAQAEMQQRAQAQMQQRAQAQAQAQAQQRAQAQAQAQQRAAAEAATRRPEGRPQGNAPGGNRGNRRGQRDE